MQFNFRGQQQRPRGPALATRLGFAIGGRLALARRSAIRALGPDARCGSLLRGQLVAAGSRNWKRRPPGRRRSATICRRPRPPPARLEIVDLDHRQRRFVASARRPAGRYRCRRSASRHRSARIGHVQPNALRRSLRGATRRPAARHSSGGHAVRWQPSRHWSAPAIATSAARSAPDQLRDLSSDQRLVATAVAAIGRSRRCDRDRPRHRCRERRALARTAVRRAAALPQNRRRLGIEVHARAIARSIRTASIPPHREEARSSSR